MDDIIPTIIAVIAIIGGGIMLYVFSVKAFESLVQAADVITIFKNLILTLLGGLAVGLGIRYFTINK